MPSCLFGLFHFRFVVSKGEDICLKQKPEISVAPDKTQFAIKKYWAQLFKANDVVS